MATYTYHEAIHNRYIRHLRPQFALTPHIANEAILIRLLLGTTKVTNNLSTDQFDQFINYSVLGTEENAEITTKIIRECLEDIALQDICDYLDKSKRSENNDFYLHLLEEISCYFYKKSKRSHTTCFLHLYRAVEYISYSFPLIYASVSREYYGTFNRLKNFFGGSKSEVDFFDDFVKKVLDTDLLETPLTFNFNTFSAAVNHNHFMIIKGLLTQERITDEVPDSSITTSYQHLLRLTIDLRNRYFHFAVGGQKNIRSTDIIENDVFFLIVNEDLLNWIVTIYFRILEVAVSKNL